MTKSVECPQCMGYGRIMKNYSHMICPYDDTIECDKCGGSGTIYFDPNDEIDGDLEDTQ